MQKSQVSQINESLVKWVESIAAQTTPKNIVWCDGSEEEYRSFIRQMLKDGTLVELSQEKFPDCYLHRSRPDDVARTEASTFICTPDKASAGPTNNWIESSHAQETLRKVFDKCMMGRTMYVVPYLMGPRDSPHSQVGVQITDSLYVAASLRIMTRMGSAALKHLGKSSDFVRGVHSMGTMDPKLRYICHFPESRLIMSINSNYGGNALLSKKCHSLRIASSMARDEGWLAEHMLIVGIEDETGEVSYITGAFPSSSGKTNLAMLRPPSHLAKFKVHTLGDDIAWMHLEADGRLYGINPEAGFFCVAPNSSTKSNPHLMKAIQSNTIFTNVATTRDNTPWWEGMSSPPPDGLVDWQGRPWKPGGSSTAAHPNSRFTLPIYQYPALSSKVEDPRGVPISAILFGGRRTSLIPLVCETVSWEHGVLVGAMMKVETTAAADGAVGALRNDPMAMLPFCGYNVSDYFQHWLGFAAKSDKLPRVFQVNWFRKGKDGRYLWPGYGENLRVVKWMIDRIHGKADAIETPIGYVPAPGSIDLEGLDVSQETMDELLRIDKEGWLRELESSREFFERLGERFPKKLWQEHRRLVARVEAT